MKFLLVLALFVASEATVSWDEVIDVDYHVDEGPVPEGRITNGEIARPKQFPYQVGLMLHLQNGASWCGGTLISNQWILTAAHCTDSITSVDVYLGAFDRTNRNEQGQKVVHVDRRNVIIHEHWNPSTIQNDISLIRLPSPVAFNEYIKPANLPSINGIYSDYSGQMAIASGWGKISDTSAKGATDKLRWIEAPIMTNSACRPYYASTVRDSNICINTKGTKSICNGDSGGPLVLADGSNTVIGATSFGSRSGCERGWPGVFTRVTSYLDWIASNSGVVNK